MAQRLDCLKTLALYSSHANRLLFGVLNAPSVRDRINEEIGGYFDSIAAILNHLALSDRRWLSRINEVWGSLELFSRRPQETWQDPGEVFATPLGTLEELESQQEALDEIFVELTDALGAASVGGALPSDLVCHDSRGTEVRVSIEGAILHVLNHHTHHRGQISQVLDQMGVENDVSSLRAVL